MTKITFLKNADQLPCSDSSEIVAELRKLADDMEQDKLISMNHISIIGIDAESGMPIVWLRSVGRFMSRLEWAGVLDFLQHMNFTGEDQK